MGHRIFSSNSPASFLIAGLIVLALVLSSEDDSIEVSKKADREILKGNTYVKGWNVEQLFLAEGIAGDTWPVYTLTIFELSAKFVADASVTN